MCELSAETLDVDRVSIWLFTKDNNALRCGNLYMRNKDSHESGIELDSTVFRMYFSALLNQRVIAADDAMTHAATKGFAVCRLPANGIDARLDTTLRIDGKFGVVCNEHIGGTRVWILDE